MTPREPSLGRFVLRTLLWLPPCFAAWYLASPWQSALASALARIFVDAFQPNLVSALEPAGLDIAFVTTLQARSDSGADGVLLAQVNPLLYTYGLALFAALMLAARARGWMMLAGALVLLPFESWGIAFDFLAQVGVRLGPGVAAQAGLSSLQREAVALGYQAGSLLFPSLAPVVLWVAFNRPFIAALSTLAARRTAPSTGTVPRFRLPT